MRSYQLCATLHSETHLVALCTEAMYGENISFDASLVIYINSTNIPPIMIINRIYEHQNLVAVACFLPGRAKDLSAPLYRGC